MSLARLVRYVIGLVIAAVLLMIILPFVGIPKSHYLPPPWIYSAATGRTQGKVVGLGKAQTGNPFRIGFHDYFVKYEFYALAPPTRGVLTPGKKQLYAGEVRVDQTTYQAVQVGGKAPIKYETTYPYINGIDLPDGGRSVGEASNILSGWLIWVLVSVILGYFIMLILERFSGKENI